MGKVRPGTGGVKDGLSCFDICTECQSCPKNKKRDFFFPADGDGGSWGDSLPFAAAEGKEKLKSCLRFGSTKYSDDTLLIEGIRMLFRLADSHNPPTPPLRWHLQPWTLAHVRSKCSLGRHGAVRPPQCWREPGIVPRPPAGEGEGGGGGGTDGSSSCRSEHKAPERSLQSVFPVLIIDKSEGTGPAGGVRPAPACQTFPFFPFPPPSALNRLISRPFPVSTRPLI